MGSGNSSPVKRAEVVETEAHQDMFEVRFDHLAFGGTAAIIIVACVILYWLYRKRKKNRKRARAPRRRHRRSHSRTPSCSPDSRRPCCHSQIGMPWYPFNAFPMVQMAQMPPTAWNNVPTYDNSRFS